MSQRKAIPQSTVATTPAPSTSPFFTRLNHDIRVMIYAYLDFYPMPNHRQSFGLVGSCRDAHEETGQEAARQLWMYLQDMKKEVQKNDKVFRLPKSIDVKDAMLGLRKLTILVDDIEDLPFQNGLLRLSLDRLEIGLLKLPPTMRDLQDPYIWLQRNGIPVQALFILSPLTKAAGRTCNMNIKVVVVKWYMSDDRPGKSPRPRVNAIEHRLSGVAKSSLSRELGIPTNYPWPEFTIAISNTGDMGKLVLRSDNRWKPAANWLGVLVWGKDFNGVRS